MSHQSPLLAVLLTCAPVICLCESSTRPEKGNVTRVVEHSVSAAGHYQLVQKKFGDLLHLPLYDYGYAQAAFVPEKQAEMLVCTVKDGSVRPSAHFLTRVRVQDNFITLHKLTAADVGYYVVSDIHGNNISVTELRVQVDRQHFTEVAGGSLEVPIVTDDSVVIWFHPSVMGRPFQLCRVEKGHGQCLHYFDDSMAVMENKITLRRLTPKHQGTFVIWHEKRNVEICHISLHVKGHQESMAVQPGNLVAINFYTSVPVAVKFTPARSPHSSMLIVNGTNILQKNAELRRGYLVIRNISPSQEGVYMVEDITGAHHYNTIQVQVRESRSTSKRSFVSARALHNRSSHSPKFQTAFYAVLGMFALGTLTF